MIGPFATATEFAELTGLPLPDDLARFQAHLEMASSLIRAYCDQVLSSVVDDVVTAYPTASTLLTLPERPVTAVSEVLVNGTATTDFYVMPRGIRSGTVAAPGSAWLSGATVTYSHGYHTTDPEFGVFRGICLEIADRALRPMEAGMSFEPSTEAVGWRTRLFLDEGQMDRLRPFKRGPVR